MNCGARLDEKCQVEHLISRMTLDPLSKKYVRFVRSVCAVTGDTEFPVRRLGSGFVVAHMGCFYFVTARHTLTNLDVDPRDIVISLPDSGTSYWPTTSFVLMEANTPYEDDNTYADVAICKLATWDQVGRSILENEYLSFPKRLDFTERMPLFAFGFPDVEYELDLEGRQHLLTLVAIEGEYAGKTSQLGIHTFRSKHLPSEPNGMSGGPVTCLDPSRIGHHLLAGMIVQGSGEQLHFIEAHMIAEALVYAVQISNR